MIATITSTLTWAAGQYRQCIVSARASAGAENYLTNNGRAEAYRQLADRVADAAGLPRVDWEAIKRAVPADGVYR